VTNLKGTTIICINESPDMYASIDMAAHALKRKLSKYKERRLDGWHGGDALNDDLMAALEDLSTADDDIPEVEVEDEFVDFDAPKVIKVDSFDLEKPKSLQEAIFALDYVDHDFYVFLSEETGKISVVYKRHLGGVGLVEP
jgi:putative sigma-54 modulation protein